MQNWPKFLHIFGFFLGKFWTLFSIFSFLFPFFSEKNINSFPFPSHSKICKYFLPISFPHWENSFHPSRFPPEPKYNFFPFLFLPFPSHIKNTFFSFPFPSHPNKNENFLPISFPNSKNLILLIPVARRSIYLLKGRGVG